MKLPEFSQKGQVLYLPMNEGTGTVANDHSKEGNDGDIIGATWVAGKILGKALLFDGTDDYVQTPDAANLRVTSEASIEAWIKLTNKDKFQMVFNKWYDGSNRSYYFRVNDTNVLRLTVSLDGTTEDGASGATALVTGRWYHVVGIFDGTDIRVFLDGVQDGITNYPGSIKVNNQVVNVGINHAAGEDFDGIIDEVRLFNRVLSAEEVKRHFASGKFIKPKVNRRLRR